MDADAARERLAARQEALLTALVAGGTPPEGFDPARLRVQTRALLAKRRRVAAAHHPWLTEALGAPRYAALFAEYARRTPLRPGGSGHADAEGFEAYARKAGALPAPARWRFLRRRR